MSENDIDLFFLIMHYAQSKKHFGSFWRNRFLEKRGQGLCMLRQLLEKSTFLLVHVKGSNLSIPSTTMANSLKKSQILSVFL